MARTRCASRAAVPVELLSVHSPDGDVRFLSSGWRSAFGDRVAARVFARGLADVVHADDRPILAAAQQLMERGETSVVVEVRLHGPGGVDLPAELTLRPSRAPAGAVVVGRLIG